MRVRRIPMQVPAKLVPFVLLATFAAVSGGCKKKPPPPTNMTYRIESTDRSLDGATVSVGGKLGTFHTQSWSPSGPAEVTINLPVDSPSALGSIAISLETPCGKKSVALKFTADTAAEERARKGGYAMLINVTPTDPLPPSAAIWVDADGGEQDDVGTVKAGRGMTRIYDYQCPPPVTIRAGSRDLGEMPTFHAGLKTHGVFVTTKPDTCYSY